MAVALAMNVLGDRLRDWLDVKGHPQKAAGRGTSSAHPTCGFFIERNI